MNVASIQINLFYSFLIFLTLTAFSQSRLNPSDSYTRRAELKPNEIFLYWNYTESDITFEAHGRTEGWIGIGFSQSGSMIGADIFLGWVKDGRVYVTDRHGVSSNAFPPKDAKQDLEILAGMECDGWTMIKFSRQLAACETDFDREITESTQRVIFAIGHQDPRGEDITPYDQHRHVDRGSKSLLMLTSIDSIDEGLILNPDYKTFDIVVDNLSIPPEDTYYNCRIFKIPEVDEKHQVIKVEPIIQKGNELIVHHIVVKQCADVIQNSSELGIDGSCHLSDVQHFSTCIAFIFTWTVGGGPYTYPKEVGFSIGSPGDPIYVMLDTHYDNPQRRADIIDSSGLRITYTNKLRKYDAGLLAVGKVLFPSGFYIPPGAKDFISRVYCTGSCLKKRMEESNVLNITIIGVVMHSHLAGRKIMVRHFRNGTELEHIGYDDNYDFNYQERANLDEPIQVLPNDDLQVDCIYNTEGRSQLTVAGLKTTDEMCYGFLTYYPKTEASLCVSVPVPTEAWKYFGIKTVSPAFHFGWHLRVMKLNDFTVTAPESLQGKTVNEVISEYNWTEENIDHFSEEISKMNQQIICGHKNPRMDSFEVLKRPEVTSHYDIPTRKCMKRRIFDQSAVIPSDCIFDVTEEPKTTTSASIVVKNNHLFYMIAFGLVFEFI